MLHRNFRDFQMNRFPRPVDPASADEFSDAEPDRFANPFDANPSRSSVSPAAEDPQPASELSAKDEKKVEQLQEAAQKSEEILPRVTERITSIMQQQIMPAAQQVVDSGAPTVLRIGKSGFNQAYPSHGRGIITKSYSTRVYLIRIHDG